MDKNLFQITLDILKYSPKSEKVGDCIFLQGNYKQEQINEINDRFRKIVDEHNKAEKEILEKKPKYNPKYIPMVETKLEKEI